jgi:copper oxidase (laccase) domain-containing protein
MTGIDVPRLHDDLHIAVSGREDGTVLDRSRSTHDPAVITTRVAISEANGFDYGRSVFLRIVYSPEATYDLLAEVDERSTTKYTEDIVADGLFTTTANIGLFLPVADCVATVIFDPVRKYLALLHLGRHSTLTRLLPDTIAHFVARGSNPSDLIVWMSPSAQKESYVLDYFDHAEDPEWQGFVTKTDGGYQIDMQGFNKERCVIAGISKQNIHVSPIDTVTDARYFSHSAGDAYGRFAVMASMS